MRGSIFLIDTTTYGASSGSVARVYSSNQHTGLFCLVDNLLTQVIEAPRVMLSPVSLSNRYPVTDSLQIFKGYPASGVFSLFNNPLADDVVNVICHSTFFAPPFFEQPFGRFSSFALEFLSQFGVALTEVIQVIASISVAIRISGNIFYAKVNADKFINILRFWRFNLTSRKKVKRAVNISQVRLAALIPQQFKLAFAAGKLYPLAALSSPDRHFLFIDVPAQDTGIVSDSAVGLKDTLSFLVQFVSVGYFRNATHDHLSGKAKVVFHIVITYFMKPELIKYTIAPRPLTYTITGSISCFQRLKQRLMLLLIRLQLHFSRKFHKNIVAQVFYCVKCLIGGIRRIPPLFENRGLLRQIL